MCLNSTKNLRVTPGILSFCNKVKIEKKYKFYEIMLLFVAMLITFDKNKLNWRYILNELFWNKLWTDLCYSLKFEHKMKKIITIILNQWWQQCFKDVKNSK